MQTANSNKEIAPPMQKPDLEKHLLSLHDLLKTEDRFFGQEEVKRHLGKSFETLITANNPSFDYFDQTYGFPIYVFKIVNGQISQFIFCRRDYFLELASEILFEIFDQLGRITLSVVILEGQLRRFLKIYLGLENRNFYKLPLEIITKIVDSHPGKFAFKTKSAVDSFSESEVTIRISEQASIYPHLFLNKLIKLSRKNSTNDVKKLLFKLNLSTDDFGMSKPYGLQTIEKIVDVFPETLKFDGEHLSVTPLKERISATLSKKSRIDNFPLQAGSLSGLLVFSFVGDEFPIKEAKTYVSLRSQISFIAVSDLKQVYDKIFTQESYELTKILKAFLGDIDVWEWAKENLAVSFLVEDFDYLKLNFDSLMQEYSPVFNLDRNPGNLFRGIIEEKIREYESGREQGTEN